MIDIFQDFEEVPENQKLFKISKRNCFVLLGRLKIIEYSISSSPGDVGEDKRTEEDDDEGAEARE